MRKSSVFVGVLAAVWVLLASGPPAAAQASPPSVVCESDGDCADDGVACTREACSQGTCVRHDECPYGYGCTAVEAAHRTADGTQASACAPGWTCSVATDTCVSPFWSKFWSVAEPDHSCALHLLPAQPLPPGAPEPPPGEREWSVEARCRGTLVGTGSLGELRFLDGSASEADPAAGSLKELARQRVAGRLVNKAGEVRYVVGEWVEHRLDGQSERQHQLVVLDHAAPDMTTAASRAAPEPGLAAGSTSCGALSPPPASLADCDASRNACIRQADDRALVAAALCAVARGESLATCLAACTGPPQAWIGCAVSRCAVPLVVALACWAGQEAFHQEAIDDCIACGQHCRCEYFLDGCQVAGSVGFRVEGLCPGEQVRMAGRCWRGNAEISDAFDVTRPGLFHDSDFVLLRCPAGADWEVTSGVVSSTINPQAPRHECRARTAARGTVAAGGEHIAAFDCSDLAQGACPAPSTYAVRVLLAGEPLDGSGVAVRLQSAGVDQTRSGNPQGQSVVRFDPLLDGASFTLTLSMHNAQENREKECRFANNDFSLSGMLNGAELTLVATCRRKGGSVVAVAAFADSNSSPDRLDVFFSPDNHTPEQDSLYVGQVVRFGPIPEGTNYRLSVNPPFYNSNMICLFENGQTVLSARMGTQPVQHSLVCRCSVAGASECQPAGDDPNPHIQEELFNQAWPACGCHPFNLGENNFFSYQGEHCRIECPPRQDGGSDPVPCPCPAGVPPPCYCTDVTTNRCHIVCGSSTYPNQPPSVSVTTGSSSTVPTSGVPRLTADRTLFSRVEAADPDGIGAFFWFIDDRLVDHLALDSPHAPLGSGARLLDVSGLAEGPHRLSVWAWDNRSSLKAPGVVQQTFFVERTPPDPCSLDSQPPSVQLTSPAAGASLTPIPVRLEAQANDASGVARVEFLIDGATPTQAFDTVAPYSYLWSAEPGTHTLRARAYDACGHAKLSAPITVVVGPQDVCQGDTQGPALTWQAPLHGTSLAPGRVSLSAGAGDPAGVRWVAFYVDGALSLRDHDAPYTVAHDFAVGGPHTLRARAFDACGNDSWSAPVTVQVAAPPPPCAADHQPPTVAIAAPAAGATVPRGQVSVALSASDDLGLDRAEFELDGSVPPGAVDRSLPFAYTFTPTRASHTLRARVADRCGHETWSAPVTFNVSNRPPVAQPDSASVSRGGSVRIAVLTNDSDPDGDPIQLATSAVIVAPAHGTATRNADGTITYTPAAGFPAGSTAGSDSFRYRILDSFATFHSALVTVTVTP